MLPGKRRALTKIQRGQLIQRVLIDGWSTAEAAAAFGLPERVAAAWIADYRRRGMASLHAVPSERVAVVPLPLALARALLSLMPGLPRLLRQLFAPEPAMPPSPSRRSHDDHRGKS